MQDSVFDPDMEFPEMHLHLDHVQFVLKSGHTRLYIPEQLLLSEADFKTQNLDELEVYMSVSNLTSEVITLKLQKMSNEANIQHRVKQGIKNQGDR